MALATISQASHTKAWSWPATPGKWKFPSPLHCRGLGWLTHKVAQSKKEIKYINNTVPSPRVLGIARILITRPAVYIIKSAEVANRWLELSRQRIWIIPEARSGRRVVSFRSTCSVFFSGLGSPGSCLHVNFELPRVGYLGLFTHSANTQLSIYFSPALLVN